MRWPADIAYYESQINSSGSISGLTPSPSPQFDNPKRIYKASYTVAAGDGDNEVADGLIAAINAHAMGNVVTATDNSTTGIFVEADFFGLVLDGTIVKDGSKLVGSTNQQAMVIGTGSFFEAISREKKALALQGIHNRMYLPTGDTTVASTTAGGASTPIRFLTGSSYGERLRIGPAGQIGIAGANYGTSGQVLTSGGSGSAVSWATPAVTAFTSGANNRVVTATSGSGLNGESNLTYDGTNLQLQTDANNEGIKINSTLSGGSSYPVFEMEANRGVGNTLGKLVQKWNGTQVASIQFSSGTDGTNKDDAHIHFNTASAGTVIERMKITSTGRVGINTTSPGRRLHVYGGFGAANLGHPLILERGDNSNTQIEVRSGGAIRGLWGASSTANFMVYDNDTSHIHFVVNQTGFVGIGRDDPNTMLDIKAPPLNTATINTTNCLQLGLRLTPDGTGSNTEGHIYNGIAVGDGYAGLYGKDGGSSAATDLAFFTGTASAVSERMRIQDDGKIIIGNATMSINRNVSISAASGNSQNVELGLQPTNSSGGYNPEVYIGATADGTYGAAMYFYTCLLYTSPSPRDS